MISQQRQPTGACKSLMASWRRGTALGGLLGLSLLGLSLAAPPVAAQGGDNAAPPTREELTGPGPRLEERETVTLTVDGQMERSPCALDDAEYAGITIRLNRVAYSGAERAADVALERAHDGYLDRDLPVRALCDIRDRAAALLEEAGYLAAVEIPPQSLGDGVAEMRVVLGRLVAIRARGDTKGVEAILSSYLGRLVGQDVFNVNDAERYLLLANDIPGADVRLSLRPAANGEPGDLVGEVAVLRRTYMADLSLQNYGSRALGRYSGLARAEFYGLTGAGDRTTFAVFSTLDFDEQQTLQLGHDFRVGSEGLTLGANLTLGWTSPDTLPGFAVESETVFANVEASYPFLRKQEASVWGAVGFDFVDQDVEVNGIDLTRDRVRTAYARVSFDLFDETSIARRRGYSPFEPLTRVFGELELRKGVGIFGASPDCRGAFAACTTGGAVAPSRIEQDPLPLLVRGRVSSEYRPVPELALAVDLRGQLSGDALPAFEEFAGGNYAIGRGYDPGAILGDSGVGVGFELRYGSLRPATSGELAIQPYIFTDLAETWQEDASQQKVGADSLWSLGGGVRFIRGANLLGDLTLAVPVRRTNSQSSLGDVRLLFTLTARLSPWRSR